MPEVIQKPPPCPLVPSPSHVTNLPIMQATRSRPYPSVPPSLPLRRFLPAPLTCDELAHDAGGDEHGVSVVLEGPAGGRGAGGERWNYGAQGAGGEGAVKRGVLACSAVFWCDARGSA